MEKPAFWNHNAAYYPWIRKQLEGIAATRILDVGCGEGSLARYLAFPGREVLGIDPSGEAIARARKQTGEGEGVRFLNLSLEAFDAPPGSMDAVIFAASLHHMEEEGALRKARELLRPGGRLLIVGLAAPSGPGDWLLEALRVAPAKLGTADADGMPGSTSNGTLVRATAVTSATSNLKISTQPQRKSIARA